MYKDYVFDLYGTLVDINTDEGIEDLWKKMSLFYGYNGAAYTPKELREAYIEEVKADESKMKKDIEVELPRYAHEAYPEIQLASITGQFFRIESTRYIKLYDGVFELLNAIRDAGGKIWLLSNAQRIFTEYELKYLGIYDIFDGILISSDEGTRKPDLRFFKILNERFGIDLESAIMIGNDARTDIGGAIKAGMDTFFIYSNISPSMTDEEIDAVKATYKLDHMDLLEVKSMLGL